MNPLLRKLSVASSSRCSLIRTIAAAAAAGAAGVAYASSDSDFKTKVLVSLPAPLGEHLRLQWPATLSSGGFSSEVLPSFSFRTSPVPSDDSLNKVPADAAESPKHCSGCIGRDSFANAAAKVGPAVVNLSIPRGSYGMTTGRSIGSGTIIDKDGTILTCAHVVVDFQGLGSLSKGKVAVTLQDGRTFEGTVVSADLHSDIAIVKINSKTPLPTANLGSSRKLRPGDWVISLGCPLSLQNTVTAGIVSCVDRKSSELGIGGMRKEYLQTDCAINGGNSGGPLVNIDGEVVGVNIMKVMGADGLGFSVPIDLVSKIITQLKKSGRVVRPWLGLRMVDLNDMIIAQLKERDPKFPNVTKGILVPAVTPDSPADRAGFLPGDVLVEFDGKSVGSISEVIEIMEEKIGVPIKVKVKRSRDRAATLTVIPEETNPDI